MALKRVCATLSDPLDGSNDGTDANSSAEMTTTTQKESLHSSPKRKDLVLMSSREEKFDDGYDTDGQAGPFFDCIQEEGEQDFDEDALATIFVDAAAIGENSDGGGGDQQSRGGGSREFRQRWWRCC